MFIIRGLWSIDVNGLLVAEAIIKALLDQFTFCCWKQEFGHFGSTDQIWMKLWLSELYLPVKLLWYWTLLLKLLCRKKLFGTISTPLQYLRLTRLAISCLEQIRGLIIVLVIFAVLDNSAGFVAPWLLDLQLSWKLVSDLSVEQL